MAKRPNRDTFMDDVERILRDCATKSGKFVCWRGRYPHVYMGNTYDYDTIVVGVSDDKESKERPTIEFAKVWLQGSGGAHYDFSDGAGGGESGTCPFGGGHDPLERVKELLPQLDQTAALLF
jgi:hypothetical protein